MSFYNVYRITNTWGSFFFLLILLLHFLYESVWFFLLAFPFKLSVTLHFTSFSFFFLYSNKLGIFFAFSFENCFETFMYFIVFPGSIVSDQYNNNDNYKMHHGNSLKGSCEVKYNFDHKWHIPAASEVINCQTHIIYSTFVMSIGFLNKYLYKLFNSNVKINKLLNTSKSKHSLFTLSFIGRWSFINTLHWSQRTRLERDLERDAVSVLIQETK